MKSKNLSNKILKTIKSRGFKFIELPPVIEANHILQRSGENFRKYLFSFNNSKGKEFANGKSRSESFSNFALCKKR